MQLYQSNPPVDNKTEHVYGIYNNIWKLYNHYNISNKHTHICTSLAGDVNRYPKTFTRCFGPFNSRQSDISSVWNIYMLWTICFNNDYYIYLPSHEQKIIVYTNDLHWLTRNMCYYVIFQQTRSPFIFRTNMRPMYIKPDRLVLNKLFCLLIICAMPIQWRTKDKMPQYKD